jgi:hypothetical protein
MHLNNGLGSSTTIMISAYIIVYFMRNERARYAPEGIKDILVLITNQWVQSSRDDFRTNGDDLIRAAPHLLVTKANQTS